MNKLIGYTLAGCIVVGVSMLGSSCDTREDWFKKEGEGATFVIQSGERTDVIDMVGNRYTEYDVMLNHITNVDFYSDTLNLKVYGLTNHTMIPTAIDQMFIDGVDLSYKKCADGSLDLYYFRGFSQYRLFESDTTAAVYGETKIRFKLKDVFDNEYTCFVNLVIRCDCPPTPVLEVKPVDGRPMEKVLSLAKSYDKETSVAKYEYCIDGNIVPYSHKDNHFDAVKGVWQSGKAAYGGTYITATSLNEVNHVFQTPGEHTINYRCMDDKGAWSTWKTETIMINE